MVRRRICNSVTGAATREGAARCRRWRLGAGRGAQPAAGFRPESRIGRDARLRQQVSIIAIAGPGDRITPPARIEADARVWTPAKFPKTVIGAGTKIDKLRQRAAVPKLSALMMHRSRGQPTGEV